MQHKLAVISLCLISLQSPVLAGDNDLDELRSSTAFADWRLVSDNKIHNIKTYLKQEQGKRVRSFKLVAELDAPLAAIARVEFDPDSYKQWYYSVIDSRLLKKVSNSEFYAYIRYNSPGGLPDRDAALQTVIQPYSARTGYMKMTIKSDPGYLPVTPGVVRITALDMVARFSPLNAGTTKMEIEGYMDPGGFAPMWAVNLVQRNAPTTTIIGLQRMLRLPKYNIPDPYTDYRYTE